jgi:hypothetical protein
MVAVAERVGLELAQVFLFLAHTQLLSALVALQRLMVMTPEALVVIQYLALSLQMAAVVVVLSHQGRLALVVLVVVLVHKTHQAQQVVQVILQALHQAKVIMAVMGLLLVLEIGEWVVVVAGHL